MNEEEIHVIALQVFEALLEGIARGLRLVITVVELRGEEDLLARNPRFCDCAPDFNLISIHLRGVDVPVSKLQSRGDRVEGVLGTDLEGAESELGHRFAV